jgi:excisionase family DNA binding protein
MPKKQAPPASNGSRVRKSAAPPRPLPVFVKRNFLTPSELRGLTRFALKHEADFMESGVIPDGMPEGATDPSYRKSRVLYDLGEFGPLIQYRLMALLPAALKVFNQDIFSISRVDVQLTASNDGDFFKVHQDNGMIEPLDVQYREISFVHYFNREPKSFSGGQLRFYELEDGQAVSSAEKRLRTITPTQNMLVLFPSSYSHEVLPVKCPARKFAHSRFTANGWIIREEPAGNQGNPQYYEPGETQDMSWLVDAVKALGGARPYPVPRLYLTLEEACEYSGLSYEYLVQLVQEQKLTAIEDGGWKIRRADLESL